MGITPLDLTHPDRWPPELLGYLAEHRKLFAAWETGTFKNLGQPDGAYDEVMDSLVNRLDPYTVVGWHCTRLTERELDAVRTNGLVPLSNWVLRGRLGGLVADGLLDSRLAAHLREKNQANRPNRSGMIWFFFFPPVGAGQSGIERFFRHWGGEALYIEHEEDNDISPLLQRIGRPTIVKANVLIENLGMKAGLAHRIARRYLRHIGLDIVEPVEHEDYSRVIVGPGNICDLIAFPSGYFSALTGCDHWDPPLDQK